MVLQDQARSNGVVPKNELQTCTEGERETEHQDHGTGATQGKATSRVVIMTMVLKENWKQKKIIE
jgi:hypothetical protein